MREENKIDTEKMFIKDSRFFLNGGQLQKLTNYAQEEKKNL